MTPTAALTGTRTSAAPLITSLIQVCCSPRARITVMSSTIDAIATAPANTNHFSCCRSSPRERRKRIASHTSAHTMLATSTRNPSVCRIPPVPTDSSVSRRGPRWGHNRIGAGTIRTAVAATVVRTPQRHRLGGGAPSGNVHTSSTRPLIAGAHTHDCTQAATAVTAGETWCSGLNATERTKPATTTNMPIAKNNQPTRLPGRRVTISAPTAA